MLRDSFTLSPNLEMGRRSDESRTTLLGKPAVAPGASIIGTSQALAPQLTDCGLAT